MLDGEITYTVGFEEREVVAGPGAAVWIPPGTPHAFKVTSAPARALNFYTPGGFDDQSPTSRRPLPRKRSRLKTCQRWIRARGRGISTGSETSIKRRCSVTSRSGDLKPHRLRALAEFGCGRPAASAGARWLGSLQGSA